LYWPWENECAPYRKTGDSCEEDYDCSPKDFCWYASTDEKKNNQTTCIELYSRKVGTVFGWAMKGTSPTYADYIQNGKLCHSGLAI
jgi:hypothetical protein